MTAALWKGAGRATFRRHLQDGPAGLVDALSRLLPEGRPEPSEVDRACGFLARQSATVAWPGSALYPSKLSTIPDPPAFLFWTGDLRAFSDGPAAAVIGSRRGSPCGLRTAHRLSLELAARGVRIVSGLARGIDGRAHRGALDGGGLTMAVLGSGLDVIYPPEHAALADEIRLRGVLMSEFPPGTSPDPFNFPLRNRLISGFSDAVVVVEAGDRSGTMITVEAALAQGRDVLAVPGDILRPGTRGSNRLLREGAGVVTCCDDVLEALGLEPAPAPGARRQERDGAAGRVTMALGSRSMHFDELVRALGVPPGALHALLLELEMKGIVEQRPGKLFGLSGEM